MVRTTCAVRDCPSSTKSNKSLKFHQFPHAKERCELWIAACGRDDLIGRPAEIMRHTYICELHFLQPMYGKQNLKKTAIPVINLPTPEKRKVDDGPSTKNSTTTQSKKAQTLQTANEKTAQTDQARADQEHAPLKRSLTKPTTSEPKKVKLLTRNSEDDDITEEQFLKGCDKFLSPQLAAIVRTHLRLKKEASPDPLHE